MDKSIQKHFVLTNTTINDQTYYIVCTTQDFGTNHHFVSFHWTQCPKKLLTGQAVNMFNLAGTTANGESIYNVDARFTGSDYNSQANRQKNLEFCANCLANSIKSMDYSFYLAQNELNDSKAHFQQYIHNKSDAMLNLLLSLSDVIDENAPKDEQNEIIFNTDNQKLWDEEREYFINETVDSVSNILYSLQAMPGSQSLDIDFINNITAKSTPIINKNLNSFNLMNQSLLDEYNAPAVAKN